MNRVALRGLLDTPTYRTRTCLIQRSLAGKKRLPSRKAILQFPVFLLLELDGFPELRVVLWHLVQQHRRND